MVYAVLYAESTDLYMKYDEYPHKLGRRYSQGLGDPHYPGLLVHKTVADARGAILPTEIDHWAVYELDADWDSQCDACPEPLVRELLVDARIIRKVV